MFSIITVTLNNLKGLAKTSESVLAQRHANFEWIVIDGGSSDGTLEYLMTIERNNIKYVSGKDSGIFDAMNRGIGMSCGEYCIFMNSGDRIFDDSVLSNVSHAIGLRRPELVYGDSYEVAGDDRWYKPARSPRLNFYVMFTHHQSIFYRREALGAGYDLSYKFSADWALTTRILNSAKAQALRYDGPICLFERGGISQSQTHRRQINSEHWRILTSESNINPVIAVVLWGVKLGTNKLRLLFPSLYDSIRY